MMRRFVNNLCASRLPQLRRGIVAVLAGAAALGATASVEAQEIQLTGPLAGAPAVRQLRLHRKGRVEIALGSSFTLLDEYQRTILPGLRVSWHPTDWLGFGIWGAYGISTTTSLTDELQGKAVDSRACSSTTPAPENVQPCKLTAVNLTRPGIAQSTGGASTGLLVDDQLGKIQFVAAPQINVVPFRGKLSLFGALTADTDISFFAGAAFVGVQERMACGQDDDGNPITACASSFELESGLRIAPTFGVGWNFYPRQLEFFGFGAEWRAMPFSRNTSGFDNAGAGNDEAFPDTAVNSKDRQFRFNSMITVNLLFSFPHRVKISE
ncbi:MAG: hypothetical protein IPM54_38025 [Polyangiaceae bacterium]|nr:hypothetical protein [Polyangiaceae bacterium]